MSMIISIASVTAFALMSAYMFVAAHFEATRRVMVLPLSMMGLELFFFGMLSGVTNPTVMMILVAVRAAVLLLCAKAMRNDAEAVKARARRRNRFHADMINVTAAPLRLVKRIRPVVNIDIVA